MSKPDATSLLNELKATGRLPSPVGVAIRVLELCRREDSEIQEIADAIMSDPALSARLLKYANSPAVGAGREVTSVRDAVLIMGLRAVKLTALGFSLASPESDPRCPGFDFKRFWIESFIRASIARRLARRHFQISREEAFTAALLAQMGRLALAHGLPEQYNSILETARQGRSLGEVELEVLGVNGAQFGSQLLRDWDIPEILVNAVEHQLDPSQSPEDARPLAQSVHAADRLSPLFTSEDLHEARENQLEAARDVIENVLKLDEETWRSTADLILGDYRQVADIFEIPSDQKVSVLDLYAEAQEHATQVGIVAQLEQRQTLEVNRELLHRATTDSLTGIANRAKFEDRIEDAARGLRRGHGHFVVLMVDIDLFKSYNDTYGHEVGDLVLKKVACAVEASLRDVDLVARHGGEEFSVLAPHTDRRGGCIIAARICQTVERLRIPIENQTIGVTVSVGLASSTDYAKPPTSEQILSDADKQLYLSKKGGRATWSYRGRTAMRPAEAIDAERRRAGAA